MGPLEKSNWLRLEKIMPQKFGGVIWCVHIFGSETLRFNETTFHFQQRKQPGKQTARREAVRENSPINLKGP